jgi:membrane-associated phospholipid phosphatase
MSFFLKSRKSGTCTTVAMEHKNETGIFRDPDFSAADPADAPDPIPAKPKTRLPHLMKVTTRDKNIIRAAKVFSAFFSPFYAPLIGVAALFAFSYLSLLTTIYKLFTLLAIYCFTVLMPKFTIFLYRKINGFAPMDLNQREKRLIPYLLSISCYLCCIYLMGEMHEPHYIGAVIITALLMQIFCAVINHWWKISTHSAAAGGVIGAFIAFSLIFNFDPTFWLCIILLLSGLVGTSRIILRRHSLQQVYAGYALGFVFGFLGMIFL